MASRRVRPDSGGKTNSTASVVPSNILYDLTVCKDWSQDAETVHRNPKEKSTGGVGGKIFSYFHRSMGTFLRSVGVPGSEKSPCNLPLSLIKSITLHNSWSISMSDDGEVLAVLQDTCVEIYSKENGFTSVIGKYKLPEESYPQWRCMAWSDDYMLAVASSNGSVAVIDLKGVEFFTIPQPESASTSGDLSSAIASLIFMKPTKGTDSKWNAKLLTINHQGLLISYLLSADEFEFKMEHTFVFSNLYPRGVSSVLYSEQHSLFIVTGYPSHGTGVLNSEAGVDGITSWRILSGSPYYKQVTDYDDATSRGTFQETIRNFRSALHGAIYGDDKQDMIVKSCLSPDGKHLLTLSTHSILSLYQVPSLKLEQKWGMDRQPCSDLISPTLDESPKKSKYLKDTPQYQDLVDVEWWSDEALILARFSGSVLVADAINLSNLLGDSPEWFDVCPQVQQAHDGGFLSLECETKVLNTSRKRSISENAPVSDVSDTDEDDDDDDLSMFRRASQKFREALYYITDMDKFEPPKKKTKLVKKTYRLVLLKSTTPEELYARKIDNEEYGVALSLAKVYKLDSDLVYQRQWRNNPVTKATIHDYLSKIRKRSWVLHECLERVPADIDAMKELLEYGLRGTDLEVLVKIGQGRDHGRFVVSKNIDLDDSFDESDEHESAEKLALKRQEYRQKLLEQIDFNNLTIEQKDVCRVRLQLLTYLRRLATYEEILGGGKYAEQRFDQVFFQKFRSQNVLEAICDYARVGDWNAVNLMLVFLGERTLPHRLAILSNLPETLDPSEYLSILPEVDGEDVLEYPQESLRELDWCEMPEYRRHYEIESLHAADFLYEENLDLIPFRDQPLTPQLLTEWYIMRACDIEKRSRLVDYSLKFIELGMRNNVKGLDRFHDDLTVMDMIVYDCNYGDHLAFSELQQMNDLERLKTIMSKSTPERHALHIQKWMKRFLEKCEAHTPGSYESLISQYLKELSVSDLQLVFKVFECSRKDKPVEDRVLKSEEQLLRSAVECIYTCERDDQLSYVLSILECLPHRRSGELERSLVKLHNEVDELELLISAAETLEEYDVYMTISSIKSSQNDVDAATKLMRKLTRRASNKNPAFKTSDWTKLQSDMSALQSKVFRCIDKYVCCEIFVESLLCSGKVDNINLALTYMESELESSTHSMSSSAESTMDTQIPFEQSVDLVVEAAKEYFNASGSYTDENIRLAEVCLNLFNRNHLKIRAELDLIASLPLLEDFQVDMLPLHIRLCQDKMALVQDALKSSITAYKQYPKLLKLANGLHLDENAVLRLTVQQALKTDDIKFAYKHCKSLMEKCYPGIWLECFQLAQRDDFKDTDGRMTLLSYCLVHCSDDMIELVLKQRMALKNEILVSRMSVTPDHLSPEPDSNDTLPSAISDWKTLFSTEAAVGALSKTTKTTKMLLSNLGDMLTGHHAQHSPSHTESYFNSQGCHPFYEEIIGFGKPCLELIGESKLEMSVAEDLLRTITINEMLSGTQSKRDDITQYSEVLLQCAKYHLPTDTALGLAFLLAIPEPCEADSYLKELPHVPLILRLGAYFYALQLSSVLSLPSYGSTSEVIERAMHADKNIINKHHCQDIYNRLDFYIRLMDDHDQACYLQSLGKDVDSHRFTADNTYKKEIILSLARSIDQLHYDTAISMSKRYSVDLWDVYTTHIGYLFVDSGLTASQIEKRINSLSFIDEVLRRSDEFSEYMSLNVRPNIAGTDMLKLLLYYKLIEVCPKNETVTPETHRKILSKLIPATPGLDYGALMSCETDPVEIIRPVLKSGNVYVLSKLSSKIPTRSGTLSTSSVFNAWAQKLFTDGPSANSKVPESSAAWVHRYEICGEFVSRMDPADNVSFIKHALFSDRTLDMVPLEARQEICRRNIKHCMTGSKKDDDNVDKNTNTMTWKDALEIVEEYQKHLEKMGLETLVALSLSSDPVVQGYYKMIDSCLSDVNKLKLVLTQMLLDGQSLELVDDILQVLPIDNWSVRDTMKDAVSKICDNLRYGKTSLSNGVATMTAFETLIKLVSEHQKESGDLVSPEDVMSLVRPLIPHTDIQISTKLNALMLLKSNFELRPDDHVTVLMYQTQALLLDLWPDRQITSDDVNTEESRLNLYGDLLSRSHQLQQFLLLPRLFSIWPKTKEESTMWMQLIEKILSKVGGKQAAENVVSICMKENMNQGVIQQSYSLLKTQGHLQQAAVLAIHSESPVLLDDVIVVISDNSEEFSTDYPLIKSIFERHLTVHFVGSPFFKILIQFLAEHQKQTEHLEPSIVVNELLQAKYATEAKEVDKMCRGQQGLRTLDAAAGAISAISRWWTKK